MSISEITKDKKYRIIVSYRDTFGQPRNKQRIISGTYKDALRAEMDLQHSQDNGFSQDMTFQQLFDDYIQNKKNVTDETLRKEKEIFNRYLIQIGNRKVAKSIPLDILRLRNKIESIDGSITQKNKAIFIFKRVCSYGNKYYNLPNYTQDLELFKKKVSEKFVYNTFTPEEFYYVLSFVTGANYRLLYELYFWTGLRRGEALALTPSDLLPSKEIRVNKSLNGFKKIGPPKNEQSYRNVMIQSELYKRLLPFAKSKGLSLFGGERYLPPSTVNGRFSRAIDRANGKRLQEGLNLLPRVRIHDLRHSHASFLASQNIPITAVSARLGHSTINETMSTYLHLFRGDDTRVIEAIESFTNLTTKTTTSNEK